MYETMALDANTIIVKSDSKKELSDIIEFISKSGKEKNMESLLKLASENRKRVKDYKFSREECYGR
jgi:predicted HAD superfamily phosphohydrolase